MSAEYLVQLEKNKKFQDVPILSQLLYSAFRWKCMPSHLKTPMRTRSGTSMNWSSEHKNPSITLDDLLLTCTCSSTQAYQSIRTETGFRVGMNSYFEVTIDSKGQWMVIGVCDSKFDCNTTNWTQSYTVGNTWLYHHDYGSFWKDGTAVTRGSNPIQGMSNGSTVGIIVDYDNRKLTFTLEGVPQGDTFTNIPTDRELFPFVTGYASTKVTINSNPKYLPK